MSNTVTLRKFSYFLSVIIAATVVVISNGANASLGNETKVQAGNGTGDISMTVYSPREVEISPGESVTWYNPTAVAEPHTVSFIFDNEAKADLVAPFAIPDNSTTFSPLITNSNTEALLTPDNTAIIAVNKRVFTPVVIDSNDKVVSIKENYTLTGTEKYVNSGWLLPNGLEQTYPGSGNTFTVTFQNAGNYNYLCLVHPYMTGNVVVK
jgi:plastocyanin